MPTTNSCNVECSVLIPARTLEDFPTDLNDSDACSTLAAWTVLWHPDLLIATEQLPSWHRADSPPEPPDSAQKPQAASGDDASGGPFVGHLFIAPAPSIDQLPDDYAARAESAGAIWITGPNRPSMLEQLSQLKLIQAELPPQIVGQRKIGVEDFFAAGFAALQIQIMTRRLRYTSNLDQIHLQTKVFDAAKAFLEQRTAEAIEALHDVFDCLAEERDHYFTSDPHLIDLVLVAPSTVDTAMVDSLIQEAATIDSIEEEGVLKTPMNVLIDADAIDSLAQREDSASQSFRQQLREDRIGWAAGGPSKSVQFDLMDYSAAARAITDAHQRASDCVGVSPPVYGRMSGQTPSDMVAAIASNGYAGVIPINFAAGTGHTAEAKVVLPISCGKERDGEIEALTAKPIDATSDAAFLSIAARLGESIDNGEIATGLLVHWPGQGCDSYHDLRRLASWSLSLGRFWKIGDYFTQGERPYHQGNLSLPASDPSLDFGELFGDDTENQITGSADRFLKASVDRQDRLINAIGDFLRKEQAGESSNVGDLSRIAKSIGMTSDSGGDAMLVVNANSIPQRVATEIGQAPAAMQTIYSCNRDRDRYVALMDVPGMGYSIVRPAIAGEKSSAAGSGASGVGGWIRNQFLGRSSTIAQDFRLQNEFMEVEISENSGGVAGVYSGGERGNRFSMRLVAEGFAASESLMRCDDILVTKSTAAEGCIEAKGKLLVDGIEIANFVNRYSLVSGSRVLSVRMQLNRSSKFDGDQFDGDDDWLGSQWENYVAARVAVQDESSVCRPLVRDKVHRSRGRRMIAPLGLVIDETQRQTLVTSDGYPLHRMVGKRFYDTLLMVHGQGSSQFNLRYGFDVAQPVAEAWAGLAPARQLSVKPDPAVAASGWFASVGPREVLISDMKVHALADNSVGVELELIATRGKSCTAKVRFYCDPQSAFRVTSKSASHDDPAHSLKIEDDAVQVPINGHDVCRIMVIFDETSKGQDSNA